VTEECLGLREVALNAARPRDLHLFWVPLIGLLRCVRVTSGPAARLIAKDLHALGITKARLFPGLDSLCDVIITDHHTIAYSPPEPPNFNERRAQANSGRAGST
jgi:hypothetical protein